MLLLLVMGFFLTLTVADQQYPLKVLLLQYFQRILFRDYCIYNVFML